MLGRRLNNESLREMNTTHRFQLHMSKSSARYFVLSAFVTTAKPCESETTCQAQLSMLGTNLIDDPFESDLRVCAIQFGGLCVVVW